MASGMSMLEAFEMLILIKGWGDFLVISIFFIIFATELKTKIMEGNQTSESNIEPEGDIENLKKFEAEYTDNISCEISIYKRGFFKWTWLW